MRFLADFNIFASVSQGFIQYGTPCIYHRNIIILFPQTYCLHNNDFRWIASQMDPAGSFCTGKQREKRGLTVCRIHRRALHDFKYDSLGKYRPAVYSKTIRVSGCRIDSRWKIRSRRLTKYFHLKVTPNTFTRKNKHWAQLEFHTQKQRKKIN